MGIKDFLTSGKKIEELQTKINSLTAKVNSTNHRPAYTNHPYGTTKTWNDKVKLLMPENIAENRIELNSANHRYHQTLKNPYFFKLTFQIMKRILGKRPDRPYPFLYVKSYYSGNQNDQTNDIQKRDQSNGEETESRSGSSSIKSNSSKINSGNSSAQTLERLEREINARGNGRNLSTSRTEATEFDRRNTNDIGKTSSQSSESIGIQSIKNNSTENSSGKARAESDRNLSLRSSNQIGGTQSSSSKRNATTPRKGSTGNFTNTRDKPDRSSKSGDFTDTSRPESGDNGSGEDQDTPDEAPKPQFEILEELNQKAHALWDEEGLWERLESACAFALGINSCGVLQAAGSTSQSKKYWDIPRNMFIKGYTKNRVLTRITVRWPNWHRIEEENLGEPMMAEETYTIGKNFVLVKFMDSFFSPYGEPMIQPYWNTGIYKENIRLLQMVYLHKGGVVRDYERIPDTMDEDEIEEMKNEYKKGMLSELNLTKVRAGVSPESVDKIYKHESTFASNVNFDIGNSILSEDSPFPKLFIEGQAESGSLGGDNTDNDKQEMDDTMFYYFFNMIEKAVKDFNKVFLGIDEEYTIIPWEISDPNSGKESDQMDNTTSEEPADAEKKPAEEEKKEDVGVGVSKKEKSNSIKFTINTTKKINSSDILAIYDGYVLYPSEYKQDDGSFEYLGKEEIKKYVEDPKSIKEFYFKNEHPLINPMEIKKSEATAKVVITGYDEKTGGAKAEAYFFEKPTSDELYLSPSYYSYDVVKDEKIYHSNIDLRNVVSTDHARAGKTIKLNKRN